MSAAAEQGYAYDNDSAQATAHHAALAEMLDGHTRRRVEELIELPGKRCLEVAAGGGSIARWLAERVGPDGHVVATDLKPQHLSGGPGLTVRSHDITSGEPLGAFDLVHARLLLNHLPQRDAALRHLIGALKPGGTLLTEDFWPTPGDEIVARAPDRATADLLAVYQRAHSAVLTAHGNDRSWSRRAHAEFYAAGLVDVGVRVHGSSWSGGGPGCRLLLAGVGQLRDEYADFGLSEQDLAEVATALLDPRLALNGYLVYQTSGRKPAGSAG